MFSRLESRLARQREQNLFRARREISSRQRPDVVVEGGGRLNFCSNDYLGLAGHEAVVEAMQRAASRYGAGAGASHLVTGHMTPHHELEEHLAEMTGAPRAILFSNGYLANLGVVTALADRHTRILSDRLNHASLIDAGVLSRARVQRFRHADADDAARLLSVGEGDALIVTDSVFSMDGDIAPVAALDDLAARYDASLVVDDAHGFGVLGDGRGALRHFGLSNRTVVMGTLGKAVGVYGAFVAADAVVVEALIQFARPYIYTTALPPAVAAGCLAALELSEHETWRRERLRRHIDRFRRGACKAGIPVAASSTPIQPVLVGTPEAALSISRELDARGLLVAAIRPPTVPRQGARLRITLTAAHSDAHVDALVDALSDVFAGLDVHVE
ncbi:MAG: 8-amino-7-oxononanoate synthase [Proteobacteria bacterium]|nr:MAG: 8-amino-7-oxononanoate synthase [Pseudomonadota bacterium]